MLVVAALFFAPYAVAAADAPSPDVVKAVREGMKSFSVSDDADLPRAYGFVSKSEAKNATLAEGFEIFTIPVEKILEPSLAPDLDPLVTSIDTWMFLIRSGGKAKTLVTVSLRKGKWEPVEWGPAEFAKELDDEFLAAWPPSRYTYRYVKIPPLGITFFQVYSKDKYLGIVAGPALAALTGGKYLEYNPRKLIGSQDTLAALRREAKRRSALWKRNPFALD